jgi:hypothetical protein
MFYSGFSLNASLWLAMCYRAEFTSRCFVLTFRNGFNDDPMVSRLAPGRCRLVNRPHTLQGADSVGAIVG